MNFLVLIDFMSDRKRHAVTYRLDSWVINRLIEIAEAEDKSVNSLIEEVLFDFCDNRTPMTGKVERLGDRRRRASKRDEGEE